MRQAVRRLSLFGVTTFCVLGFSWHALAQTDAGAARLQTEHWALVLLNIVLVPGFIFHAGMTWQQFRDLKARMTKAEAWRAAQPTDRPVGACREAFISRDAFEPTIQALMDSLADIKREMHVLNDRIMR